MYELVKTAEQKEIFNSIWRKVWNEKGYEVEETQFPLSQLLFQHNGNYVATVEFKRLIDSEIQYAFDFEVFPFLHQDYNSIVEIDKLAVSKDHRNVHLLRNLISTIVYYSKKTDIPWLVALIEPRLYAVISRHFWVDVKKLASSFHYKGDAVIPICIDTRIPWPTKEEYPWLIENTALIERI